MVEHLRIDHDVMRLVKRANQVLAGRMVHADFPADCAVHLREQRRRHLREGQPAQETSPPRTPRVSPSTPPPTAMMPAPRSAPSATSSSYTVDTVLQVLVALAVGNQDDGRAAERAAAVSPCSFHTVGD